MGGVIGVCEFVTDHRRDNRSGKVAASDGAQLRATCRRSSILKKRWVWLNESVCACFVRRKLVEALTPHTGAELLRRSPGVHQLHELGFINVANEE